MGFSQRFKPGVTKRVLLFFAAGIWGFAAFKILWMVDKFLDDPSNIIWNLILGAWNFTGFTYVENSFMINNYDR